MRDNFFERLFLIGLAQIGKDKVSFSVGIKNIVSSHLECRKYLSPYSVDIKYIVTRH